MKALMPSVHTGATGLGALEEFGLVTKGDNLTRMGGAGGDLSAGSNHIEVHSSSRNLAVIIDIIL
jgi:hypothetical protein